MLRRTDSLAVAYFYSCAGSKFTECATKMAAEPTKEWSDEQLNSDDLPKKDIIKFLQDNAAHSVWFTYADSKE